jgi:hypothetical protein
MRLTTWLFILLCVAPAAAPAAQDLVKDPQGKTLAILLDCNSCKDGKGKNCRMGAESGFHEGQACGQCLLDANFGARIGYPYDVHIYGKLQDPAGKPLPGKFVSVSLPNTWRIRTRTLADGRFRVMLGATMPKQTDKKLLAVDLGVRTLSDTKAEQYTIYMLQEGYKPCAPPKK